MPYIIPTELFVVRNVARRFRKALPQGVLLRALVCQTQMLQETYEQLDEVYDEGLAIYEAVLNHVGRLRRAIPSEMSHTMSAEFGEAMKDMLREAWTHYTNFATRMEKTAIALDAVLPEKSKEQ